MYAVEIQLYKTELKQMVRFTVLSICLPILLYVRRLVQFILVSIICIAQRESLNIGVVSVSIYFKTFYAFLFIYQSNKVQAYKDCNLFLRILHNRKSEFKDHSQRSTNSAASTL